MDMEKESNQEKEPDASHLLVPGAVILAGLFIAGAIVATNGLPSELTQPSEDKVVRQEVLGAEFYTSIARDLRLNVSAFSACLEENRHEDRVTNDFKDAIAVGGTGTPHSIVINAQGEMSAFSGAITYQQLTEIIADARANAETFSDGSPTTSANVRPVSSDDHVRGNPNAPITLVEYSDLECPFCARYHPTLLRLLEEFPNDVKWVYRHFPLTSIHNEALPAAIASECAGELGGEEAFWGFVDRIFSR